MSDGGKHPQKGDENISKVRDKLQRLFGRGKSQVPLTIPKPTTQEVILTPEILKEIGPESPANNRLKTIGQLCEEVRQRRLENNAVEALWGQISDLLHPNVAVENRHLALHFLQCLLQGQLQYMTILRAHFFRVIQNLTEPDDLKYRVELFATLSEGGKNLLYFEDETGQLLLDWMPEVMAAGHITKLLPIILFIIKYNAAYIDENIVSGLVKKICVIPNRPRTDEELRLCLEVMDAVIRYSYLPTDSMYHFIAALCHTVDKKTFCEKCWELMRKLLGTYLGHSAIYTMCCMLQDKRQPVNALLLRGAIFFTGMALWGSRKVQTLKHTHASVLPSFHQALSHGDPIVAYEVILNVQRLVNKYGKDLHPIAWEIVMDILEKLLIQIDHTNSLERRTHGAFEEDVQHKESSPPSVIRPPIIRHAQELRFEKKIMDETHSVITCMETLHNTRQFFGPTARLFKIVEMCASNRPTSSVCALMDYHMQSIHPGVEDWIQDLDNFMEKYLKGQTRTDVRKKALEVLSLLITINSHAYEKELLEGVVIPHFNCIDTDLDPQVRCKAVELLLTLSEDCNTDQFFQLTSIVERIMMKPVVCALMEGDKQALGPTSDESVLIDIQKAVNKTIEVFRSKLYTTPASHCVKLYEMLVDHIELHYKHMYLGTTACSIRKSIFDLLVLLKADSNFRVGLSDRKPGQGHVYSPYVLCSPSEDFEEMMMKSPGLSGISSSQMYSVIEYKHTFKAFLNCLELERDWNVLQTVLQKLPIILECKTLVLSADSGYIDDLCAKLCAVVKDRTSSKSQKLINRPKDFTRSDLHSFFFPVLASMVTYHASLDRTRLKELVNCLEFGLVSKCAKICVTTLRICSLEMKDLMMRMLPTVLLSLSRITATISMAIPVLAFLSSIVRIPMLYANFVEDQYMSVFAIALPYTNPFKFSHYTVSLAHHVIGVWFIRCRLPFRKGFVKYIQRGLKYNVLQLFEENSLRHLNSSSNQNQNSSDRGRSGSLNEGRKRTRNHSGVEGVRNDGRIPMDESMSQFHKELTETCVDMMSRYAFGNYAAFPKRSPIVDFLLKDGQKDTWVVGNKIITITTSGSGNPSNPSGLCDKCMVAFQTQQQQQTQQAASPASSAASPRSDRRRHKSMASLSKSHMEGFSSSQDGDDLLLHRHRYQDDMRLLQEPNPSSNSNPMSFDDVAVQTGTSLGIGGDFTGLDSMTSDMKEPRAFLSNQCSCWCTGWAEVHIRGASGVISWMMRIANEPSSYSFTLDPSVPDITQLLAPVRCKTPDSESLGKIDSGSLCEEEYETLHSQHFSEAEKNLFQEDETPCSVPPSSNIVTAPQQVPTSADTSASSESQSQVHSPSSLRRISSSPSLTCGIPLLETAVDCIRNKRDKSVSPEHAVIKRIEVTECKSSPRKADDFSRMGGGRSANDEFECGDGIRPPAMPKEFSSQFAKKMSQSEEESTASISLSTSTSNIVEDVFNSSHDSMPSIPGGVGDGGVTVTTSTRAAEPVAATMNTSHTRKESPATGEQEKMKTPSTKSEKVEMTTQTTPTGRGKKAVGTRSYSVDLPGQKRPQKLKLTTSMEKKIPQSTDYPEDSNSSWRDEVPELRQMKRRGHTISVMSPSHEAGMGDDSDGGHYKNAAGKDGKGGLNPSFVFLQLYHCHPLIQTQEVPIHVPNTGEFQRTVERLDHIYPYETHKIGVLYMGRGQKSEEKALLSNEYGSPRYTQFIQDLGQMISIEEAEKEKLYLGGLTSEDGKFTVAWNDESLRVVFHVATLMRSRPSDQNCNYKKSHIGNDFVSIVYNDSSEYYKIGTISGQFNFVSIVIRPLDHGSNAVYLITKEDIADILGHTHTKIISDKNLPLLVRQIAIHCNLASMVLQRQQSAVGSPEVFASNWLERLRKIKLLKKRVLEHYAEKNGSDVPTSPTHGWPHSKAGGDAAGIGIEDFTDYV